jgi:oligopeptide transport system substrate-binding protein
MKRFKVRNSFVLMLLAALILPILAACGGTAQTSQPTAAPAAPAATEAPAAPAATEAPATEAPAPTDEPAATEAPVASGGENILRINVGTWPDDLNPQRVSFSNEIAILGLNYEGLTGLDKDLQTVPAAAESWEYSDDAQSITFTLRDNLKYSDGSPLTAQDFVNAALRWLDPRDPGDYQGMLEMVVGAAEVLESSADDADLDAKLEAVGIKALDEKTIQVDLVRPTPFFHTVATMWGFFPAKQELVDAGGENWWLEAENHIGNGPFQISTIDQSNGVIEFVANQNYWQGAPKLDGVRLLFIGDANVAFQAYKNDEIDIIFPDPNDVAAIKADPVLSQEYVVYAGACTLGLEFNVSKPPFDNLKVREAFAYGFDREGFAADAMQGTVLPTLSWIPAGFPGYDAEETRFAYDPDAAKAALAEAGYPNGEGLPEVKYSYSSSNPANQGRAEYLAQMYQKSLGINLVLDPVEATTLTNLRKSAETHPNVLGGWCADYPDPQNWLSVYFQSQQQFAANIGYANAEFDALVAQADVTVDEDERLALYMEAQKIVVGDVAHVFVYNTQNDYLIKPYVKGLDLTPQDSSYPGQETALFNVTIER